jgi:hypothetical protein
MMEIGGDALDNDLGGPPMRMYLAAVVMIFGVIPADWFARARTIIAGTVKDMANMGKNLLMPLLFVGFLLCLLGVVCPMRALASPKDHGNVGVLQIDSEDTNSSALRRGLVDVALVIDGTGSMKVIVDDVNAEMSRLVDGLHRLVPETRIGIVIFGGKGEPMDVQPLTFSKANLQGFLGGLNQKKGGDWEEDTVGGCQTAIEKMEWRPHARLIIVLIGDSPPNKNDFGQLTELLRSFQKAGGEFDAIDVAEEEHRRFEVDFWRKSHHEDPPSISPLPEFYQQAKPAYRALTNLGGGTMETLGENEQIDDQIWGLATAGLGGHPSSGIGPTSNSVGASPNRD